MQMDFLRKTSTVTELLKEKNQGFEWNKLISLMENIRRMDLSLEMIKQQVSSSKIPIVWNSLKKKSTSGKADISEGEIVLMEYSKGKIHCCI